jgi:hypothetical protein
MHTVLICVFVCVGGGGDISFNSAILSYHIVSNSILTLHYINSFNQQSQMCIQ